MPRAVLIALFCLVLAVPSTLRADDALAPLEAVAAAALRAQPGLKNYQAIIETTRIKELMAGMTAGMPANVTPPPAPVIAKFWQRGGPGLTYALQEQQNPYVEKMVQQFSTNLAVDLGDMLLPAAGASRRSALAAGATVKASEVAVADSLTRRLELRFAQPADLAGAFYAEGMRLPQKQVTALTFDIDTKTSTVSELTIATAAGLHLAVEIRYLAVAGGHLPERYHVTSPDGGIDDLFEVKFVEVDGFQLPASMHRVLHRPGLDEDLVVRFKDYRVNQPIPDDVRALLPPR